MDSDTVELSRLNKSGYTILHRPYFSMRNSTHKKWMLNPHTKEGVDAAADDADSMAFSDFPELFEIVLECADVPGIYGNEQEFYNSGKHKSCAFYVQGWPADE